MKNGRLTASWIAASILAVGCGGQPASAPGAPPPAAQALTPASAALTAARVPGPMAGTRITEAYARTVARGTYVWAWALVNMYNRRIGFKDLPEPGRLGGVLPAGPPNRLSMLTDYIEPSEREVACPNQDVAYGGGGLALDLSPVVLQVPDFGDRFWVYQVVDTRTDSFVKLGKMYDTKPGFYLLVGPDWKGETPKGIAGVFRSTTSSGWVIPRLALNDTAEDRAAIQPLIRQINMYPLAEFDGTMKERDWTKFKTYPTPPGPPGGGESPKVIPEKFFDELPLVLKDAPPLPGEQARYAEALALVDAAAKDPKIKAAIIDEAVKAEKELITPLFQFANSGIPLPHNWTTIRNGAQFGTDYYTRTAAAKSNIYVNKPNEATYFYQDLDDSAARLNGAHRYTVTFTRDAMPPVKGFWSLTLYDAQHFFFPNPIKRFSVGTKNKDLVTAPDGSLTIYVQPTAPTDPQQRANWLPSPTGKDFTLYVRTYWPADDILNGRWTPPAVLRVN